MIVLSRCVLIFYRRANIANTFTVDSDAVSGNYLHNDDDDATFTRDNYFNVSDSAVARQTSESGITKSRRHFVIMWSA